MLNPNEIPEAVLFGQFRAASCDGSPVPAAWWAIPTNSCSWFQGFTAAVWVVSDYFLHLPPAWRIQGQSTSQRAKVVLRLGGDQLGAELPLGADVVENADLLRQKSTFGIRARQARHGRRGLLSKLERSPCSVTRGAERRGILGPEKGCCSPVADSRWRGAEHWSRATVADQWLFQVSRERPVLRVGYPMDRRQRARLAIL